MISFGCRLIYLQAQLRLQKRSFDARVSQLPTAELVEDYFAWRQEDAHRNSLNAHCYWLLRKQGQSVQAATSYLIGRSTADKNESCYSSMVLTLTIYRHGKSVG